MGIWRRSAYANLAGVYNRASSRSKHYGCDPMPGIERGRGYDFAVQDFRCRKSFA
jgi:hypothetical protein